MFFNSFKRRFLLIAGMSLVLLSGCATSPYQPEAKKKSDALLDEQFRQASTAISADPKSRILYAGFGMHSQSKVFRNDVVSVEQKLKQIDPHLISIRLNNPALGDPDDWPYATQENIERVLTQLGSLARPQDKVVVLFSSHGNKQVIGINASAQDFKSLSPTWINRASAGLRGKPTLFLVSSCYSGSFLPEIAGPSRIVLTASAADRSSFGCNFYSTKTFFIEALTAPPDYSNISLKQLFEQAKQSISTKEATLKLTPSLPQNSVGNAVQSWYEQPMGQWLKSQ
jgi:Peptidase C13 family